MINTDDAAIYRNKLTAYKAHHVVNHSEEEYARTLDDGTVAHTNTAESFFSLLKRGVVGAWHHVSQPFFGYVSHDFPDVLNLAFSGKRFCLL